MTGGVLETFKAEHLAITSALDRCESLSEIAPLLTQLKQVRDLVVRHLKAKDAFYPQLATLCAQKGDQPGTTIVRIFESNMVVQSAAVTKFFEGLDAPPAPSFLQSFKTVAHVLRQRLTTEERAVFPIYAKHTK